jgi:hypothetical protein
MCCCQATTGNVYIVVDIIFRRERDFVGGLICLGCCRPLYIVLYIPSPLQQHGGKRERKKQLAKLQTVWAWLDPFHLYVWWLLCAVTHTARHGCMCIEDWRMLLYTAYIIYGAESIKCCVGNGSDSRYTLSTITI